MTNCSRSPRHHSGYTSIALCKLVQNDSNTEYLKMFRLVYMMIQYIDEI